jgi:putative DNA primase/helicase
MASRKAEIERNPHRPKALPVHPEAIPSALREVSQWVCWQFEWRQKKPGEGKWTKVPIDPKTGRRASTTDSTTWSSFAPALAFYQSHRAKIDGIGFVFAADDPFFGVDLDDARNPETGELEPWASTIVKDFDTFTEVSPSNTGLKLFGRGKVPPGGHRKDKVEVYDAGRYFAVTGHRLPGTPATVNDCRTPLSSLHDRLFTASSKAGVASVRSGINVSNLDDEELIRRASRAQNGEKFRALWAGDTSGYEGDDSRADLALCIMLAFWTGPDEKRIDALFRQSGLYRPKWQRADYRERTIAKALAGRTDYYTPRQENRTNSGPSANGASNHTGNPSKGPGPADGNRSEIHLTDLGNARRVVARHGQDLRYCHPWKTWLIWDGRHWAEDATGEVVRRVKETQGVLYQSVASQIRELGEVGDDDERKKEADWLMRLLKHALAWEDARAIDRCLKLATSEPRVPILPADLDADPFLLNVLNGTIDLRTGRLREHRRGDLLTKLAPVEYQPNASCPLWLRFLERIMDDNAGLIGYLQRVVGYCLTGDVREQCLWLFHGSGANGKSTFLGAILAMLGDYAMQAVSELLIQKHNESHPTERADLFGKRLVCTIETDQGKRIAESLMKQLTGGDKVRARKMRKDFFEFDMTAKIVLAANHKPAIRGTDHAVWRRIKLVPFTVTISDEEKDKELPLKLKTELSGILRWAVEGCLDWQRNGLGEPDEVRQATTNYQGEQDMLAGFVTAQCFVHPTAKVQTSKLYSAYQEWSGDKTTTQKAFTELMADKGFPSVPGTGNRKFYEGVGLPA